MYSPLEARLDTVEVSNPIKFLNKVCFISCLALHINLFFTIPEKKLTILFSIHKRKPYVSNLITSTLSAPGVAELKSVCSQKLSTELMEGSKIIRIKIATMYHFCFKSCFNILVPQLLFLILMYFPNESVISCQFYH